MPTSRPAPPITAAFHAAGVEMARRLGLSWVDLLLVMNFESAGINPGAANPAGAYGLIQFTNLKGVGWTGTVDEFLDLSPEEQLPYVERFLTPYKTQRLDSSRRIHQALFVPATLPEGSSPDLVLVRRDGDRWGGQEAKFYSYNSGLDTNGKGYITPSDLEIVELRASKTPRFQTVLDQVASLHPEYAEEARALRDATVPRLVPVPQGPSPLAPSQYMGRSMTDLFILAGMFGLTWWIVKNWGKR